MDTKFVAYSLNSQPKLNIKIINVIPRGYNNKINPEAKDNPLNKKSIKNPIIGL